MTDIELSEAYSRLRRIAARLMEHERDDHTLAPTEVVHEALARLLERDEDNASGGEEFVTRAVHVMRHVLVDHARRRGARKRGGGIRPWSLEALVDVESSLSDPDADWESLDAALSELACEDRRRHEVVVLRFFGGLDNRQIAKRLDVDERTVSRDWTSARLWLKKKLREE